MIYQSTRGSSPEVDFAQTILGGLAPDGGLYVPKSIPLFDASAQAELRGADLTRITCAIAARFAEASLTPGQVDQLLKDAFAGFTHPAITPLVEIGQRQWLLELFHGPTLAFKDVAMQVLAPLLGHFLGREDRTALILGATSGDTGGAAMAAFVGTPSVKSVFLYPHGGVSSFQAAQMQGLSNANHRAIAVNGSFDDCQRIVKSLLKRPDLRARLGLTAVNSVNWGRILAQSAYYARTALILGRADRPVDFVVPTGNFGNVYAGWIARRMGFPVGRLTLVVNENDSLQQVFQHGQLKRADVIRTNTPAIDIQIASNLERLVYDISPGDVAAIATAMNDGTPVLLPQLATDAMRDCFDVIRVAQDRTLARIKSSHSATGQIVDPHTALAIEGAAMRPRSDRETVVLSTAHPIKFRENVESALGFQVSENVATHQVNQPIAVLLPIDVSESVVEGILENCEP